MINWFGFQIGQSMGQSMSVLNKPSIKINNNNLIELNGSNLLHITVTAFFLINMFQLLILLVYLFQLIIFVVYLNKNINFCFQMLHWGNGFRNMDGKNNQVG